MSPPAIPNATGLAKLARLIRRGTSRAECAAHFRCTAAVISRYVARLRKQGHDLRFVDTHPDCRAIEPHQERELLGLVRAGHTLAAVALHFGCSRSTAGKSVRRLRARGIHCPMRLGPPRQIHRHAAILALVEGGTTRTKDIAAALNLSRARVGVVARELVARGLLRWSGRQKASRLVVINQKEGT